MSRWGSEREALFGGRAVSSSPTWCESQRVIVALHTLSFFCLQGGGLANRGGGSGKGSDEAHRILEEANDRSIADLEGKVSALKRVRKLCQ
jgi:hypothetical protein